METVLTVVKNRMGIARARLQDINKRAGRIGVPGFTLEVLEGTERLQRISMQNDEGVFEISTPVVDVRVSGEPFSIGNWRVMAVIRRGEGGLAQNTFAFDGTQIPERYRNCSSACDHCHSDRDRKVIFLVENTEAPGEIRQVGKSCLKDYTGFDPATVLRNMSIHDALNDLVKAEMAVLRDGLEKGAEAHYFETEKVLALAFNEIWDYGYVSARMAEKLDALLVANGMLADFEMSMLAIAESEMIDSSQIGVAAWMAELYNSHPPIALVSAPVDAEELDAGLEVKVLSVRWRETQWGAQSTVNMATADGRSLVWYTASSALRAGEFHRITASDPELAPPYGTSNIDKTMVKRVKSLLVVRPWECMGIWPGEADWKVAASRLLREVVASVTGVKRALELGGDPKQAGLMLNGVVALIENGWKPEQFPHPAFRALHKAGAVLSHDPSLMPADRFDALVAEYGLGSYMKPAAAKKPRPASLTMES